MKRVALSLVTCLAFACAIAEEQAEINQGVFQKEFTRLKSASSEDVLASLKFWGTVARNGGFYTFWESSPDRNKELIDLIGVHAASSTPNISEGATRALLSMYFSPEIICPPIGICGTGLSESPIGMSIDKVGEVYKGRERSLEKYLADANPTIAFAVADKIAETELPRYTSIFKSILRRKDPLFQAIGLHYLREPDEAFIADGLQVVKGRNTDLIETFSFRVRSNPVLMRLLDSMTNSGSEEVLAVMAFMARNGSDAAKQVAESNSRFVQECAMMSSISLSLEVCEKLAFTTSVTTRNSSYMSPATRALCRLLTDYDENRSSYMTKALTRKNLRDTALRFLKAEDRDVFDSYLKGFQPGETYIPDLLMSQSNRDQVLKCIASKDAAIRNLGIEAMNKLKSQ